jgi:hypothetical protein
MLTRTRRRALLALVPLAAVPLLVAATHGSRHLTALSCGDLITTSTTLSADLGPCGGTGVTISADHVTLNLNGHRIFGTGPGGVQTNRVGVVVENGSVVGFSTDVALSGDSSRVMNVHVGSAATSGIDVTGKNDVISGNRVFGSDGDGIVGTGAGSQYTNNILQSSSHSGLIVTDAASISGNKALNNGESGIAFDHTTAGGLTVTNNLANGNHLNGITGAGAGDPTVVTLTGNKAYFNGQLGISGQPGVTDGGNNKAASNGTAAQCNNVVCS